MVRWGASLSDTVFGGPRTDRQHELGVEASECHELLVFVLFRGPIFLACTEDPQQFPHQPLVLDGPPLLLREGSSPALIDNPP